MQILQALLLGLIQGLTEFIPVSSSGHLLLAEQLFNLQVGGLLFDVMLHAGTLLALIVYFWKDLVDLVVAVFTKKKDRLWMYVLIGTIPAVVLGYLLQGFAENSFRSQYLVAFNLVVVGLLMLVVDRSQKTQDLTSLNGPKALFVGVAQALALIPGVSRSGITIVAGRFLGLDRAAAARFAFLLAIPITFGAIVKLLADGGVDHITTSISVFAAGIASSAVVGYLTIRWLLAYLQKHRLAPFAYYRMALAAVVLIAALI